MVLVEERRVVWVAKPTAPVGFASSVQTLCAMPAEWKRSELALSASNACLALSLGAPPELPGTHYALYSRLIRAVQD